VQIEEMVTNDPNMADTTEEQFQYMVDEAIWKYSGKSSLLFLTYLLLQFMVALI